MQVLIAAVQMMVMAYGGSMGASLANSAGTDGKVGATARAESQPEKPVEPAKKEPEKGTAPESKQPEKAKQPEKSPADPSTEDVLKQMEKERGNAPAPTPSTAPPAVEQAPAAPNRRVRTGRLLREGTFLVDRRGRMVRAANGDWMYTFDADAKGQADPTMVLMPCQKLEAMEKLAERYGESITFTLTGQVFVYKNRNYLLPGPFRVNRANDDIKTTQ
jgi:hypothetical protein